MSGPSRTTRRRKPHAARHASVGPHATAHAASAAPRLSRTLDRLAPPCRALGRTARCPRPHAAEALPPRQAVRHPKPRGRAGPPAAPGRPPPRISPFREADASRHNSAVGGRLPGQRHAQRNARCAGRTPRREGDAALDQAHARIADLADRLRGQALAVSHQLHAQPELGHHEVASAKLLTEFCREFGFEVETGTAGFPTAFRATHRGGDPAAPTVGILAEYDALPEIGHACGHNMIAAVATGAGIVLQQALREAGVAGNVVIVGTPAEEVPPPVKTRMFERGAMAGLDFVLMFHGGDRTQSGAELLALDAMEFHFRGRPSHASAAPDKGRSALDAATITQVAIEFLREHIPQETRIHGIVIDGGQAANVVPETAALRYFVRAPRRRHVDEVVPRVRDCARAGALAAGCEVEVREIGSYHNRINVSALNDRMLANAAEMGAEQIIPPEGRASNDSGTLSWHVPVGGISIAFVPVGTGGHSHPWVEAAGAEAGDRCVMTGIKTLAATGWDLLADGGFRSTVQSEFPKALEAQR